MRQVFDLGALLTGVAIAAAITAVLLWANDGNRRVRLWTSAALLVASITAIAAFDVAREPFHETRFSTPLTAAVASTLGALGILRATRRVQPWARIGLVFTIALVLLFSGL